MRLYPPLPIMMFRTALADDIVCGRRIPRKSIVAIMPGLDDYPRRTEVTYPADAQRLLDFARANGIGLLSMWAIQRDNGGCPGNTGSNSCSGIVQNTWDFTHLLAPFTGP